jgi:hypothetical protein
VFACVCAPGLYKKIKQPPDSGFVCALCEPGHFCPGDDVLAACPFNTYSVGGVVTACAPCAELSRAATAAPLVGPQQCQCLPGAEGSFGEHCRLCAPGKFQPLDLTFNGTGASAPVSAVSTACQPCAHDEFQTQLGATACVPCHAHSSTAGAAGSDAAEDCTCDAGFVGEDGWPAAGALLRAGALLPRPPGGYRLPPLLAQPPGRVPGRERQQTCLGLCLASRSSKTRPLSLRSSCS